jgi:hypothetical protein
VTRNMCVLPRRRGCELKSDHAVQGSRGAPGARRRAGRRSSSVGIVAAGERGGGAGRQALMERLSGFSVEKMHAAPLTIPDKESP